MARFGPLNTFISSRAAQAAVSVIAVVSVIGAGYATYAAGSTPKAVTAAAKPAAAPSTTSTVRAAVSTPNASAAPVIATTSTTSTVPPRPSILVASSEAGRLVLIDPSTGKTTRVLASYPKPGTYCTALGTVALSPDAKNVYFALHTAGKDSAGDDTCPSSIYKMSTSGGSATLVIKDGDEPTLSPDGNKLAYTANTNMGGDLTASSDGPVGDEVSVRNVATGSTTAIANTGGCDCGSNMSWAPDSVHLAYQEVNCGCGGQPFDAINVIDTENPDAPFVTVNMPNSLANKAQWSFPSYRPDGSMFVIENPTEGYDPSSPSGIKAESPAPRMLIVNPTNSTVEKVVTTGYANASYEDTAIDHSGDHILYIREGVLMVSDNLGRPVQLATGLVSARW